MNHRKVEERFLVTGALGCIGAWTVRALVREGVPVVAFDLGRNHRRLDQIMTREELAEVTFLVGDITDLTAIEVALDEHRITNVVHLAALQVPFCRADPPLGALVNVVGTVNVFEAVKRRLDRMAPLVYTSSMGAYSAADVNPVTGRLHEGGEAHPTTHYGVYKVANEGTARIYALDDGLSSIGLRPMTVYGAGRDQGMTSSPTVAIAAAVLGLPFTITFGGRTLFQYAEDVAGTLMAASRSSLDGAHVFNLGGHPVDISTWVEAIEAIVPDAAGLLTITPTELPFPSEIDHAGLAAIGPVPVTPFLDGIHATVEIFRGLAAEGRLVGTEQGLAATPAGSA
ncbi:MAG: NAD(P)-dependent oxidoreductase [Candidatus Limnocylindrales bacterium]|nr:NAD(P)-dependent oxidoreductase [Candidatus Limnocylindrales bacterium]